MLSTEIFLSIIFFHFDECYSANLEGTCIYWQKQFNARYTLITEIANHKTRSVDETAERITDASEYSGTNDCQPHTQSTLITIPYSNNHCYKLVQQAANMGQFPLNQLVHDLIE